VHYAGANVVNESQQRFLPAQQQNVEVDLLFYGIDVHAHDALFGFSSDSAVDLIYPDGTSRRFSLDDNGQLRIPALPRGDYTLTTSGSGPHMSRPLAISREQVVDLAVYSWLDVLTILAGFLVLTAGLAVWGRARRSRARHADTTEDRTATDMGLDDPAASEVVPPRGA
jgi:hypothetical protein